MDIKLFKVKLKFQSKDLKRTFQSVGASCFPSAQLPVLTLGTGHLPQSGQPPLWMPRQAEPEITAFSSPTETRVPFTKLTGATGSRNNKQINGVVFVEDKGLNVSSRLLGGLGRHSNHLPQIVSVS